MVVSGGMIDEATHRVDEGQKDLKVLKNVWNKRSLSITVCHLLFPA